MATTREKREKKKSRVVSARRRAEKHGSGTSQHLIFPDGIKPFRPPDKGSEFTADFVPYQIEKAGVNPFAYTTNDEPLEPGEQYYERTYYLHRGIGPEEESVICPKSFKKPCPVCQHAAKLRRDSDFDPKDKNNPLTKTINALRPSERQLFVLIPRSGDAKGKLHVWDISNWFFGKYLDGKIQKSKEEKGYDNFFDLENGKTLEISGIESSFAKGYYEYPSITFLPRKALNLDMDDVPCLDNMLKEVSYEDLEKLFMQVPTEEDEEDSKDEDEDKPKKKKKSKEEEDDEDEDEEDDADEDDSDDDEDDDKPKGKKGKKSKDEDKEQEVAGDAGITVGCSVEHKKHGVCEVTRISNDGTSLTLQDEDENAHKAVAVSDVKLVEDDEDSKDDEDDDEDEKPKSKKGKKPTKEEEEEEDEDDNDSDDDDDSEDDDEKDMKSKKTKKSKEEEDEDDNDSDDEDEDDD